MTMADSTRRTSQFRVPSCGRTENPSRSAKTSGKTARRTESPQNDPNRLDRPSRRAVGLLRRIARAEWRTGLARAEAGRAIEWFLIRRAAIWFRLWPHRLAAMGAERAIRRMRRHAVKTQADARLRAEFQSVIDSMLARAAIGSLVNGRARPWSRRELVARAGLTWGTFHRALAGALDFGRWLPRLHAAAERLTLTPERISA